MATAQLVKWPGANIYEDTTHRLVTDEQIARWYSGIPKIEIECGTDMNDYTTTGILYTTIGWIGYVGGELSNSPCNIEIERLLGGIVIDSTRGDDVHIVTQILYDSDLTNYIRNGHNDTEDGSWVWENWNRIYYENISVADKIELAISADVPPSS